jgi:type VI secretion system protein ImpF
MNMQRFRDAVLRDLAWLLNAKCHPESDGFGQYPYVDKSVLNYGMPDISGSTASDTPALEVTQMVRRAIENFEPRIISNTLQVRSIEAPTSAGTNVIALEIRAQIWALPLPESLYVKTEVDLETGSCQLKEFAG